MTDEHDDELEQRYDVFRQLDHKVSAFGPGDVTAEMAERLLTVFKTIGRDDSDGDRPSATAIDLAARAQRRIETPTWEATWDRFKREIRDERIRLGRQLGIEPEAPGDTPDAP